MTFLESSTAVVTSDASSAASTFTDRAFNGYLTAIQYTPSATATAYSTAVGATFSAENSGMKLLSLSPFNSTVDVLYSSRTSIHSTAGSTIAGFDRVPLVNERIRIDLSSAGVAKSGTFRFFVE